MRLTSFILALAATLALTTCGPVGAATVGCPAPVKLTICSIPTVDEFPFVVAIAARFAARYYTERQFPGFSTGASMGFNIPNVTWDFVFLGNGKHSSRNVVRAWALEGATNRCDALIGQGYSSLAMAVSPMVDERTAWVAPLATSDALSNKDIHPAFNRVLPTDRAAVSLTAAVFKQFGWAHVNLFCYDDDYGRSLSEGLRQVMSTLGGRIERSQCTADVAGIDAAAVRRILDVFVAESPSRVVYMAMFPGPSFDTIVDVIVTHGYDKKLIFVFSEAACTTTTEGYIRIASALCVTYLSNATLDRPFSAAYSARNVAPVQAALTAIGANTSHPLTVTSLLTSLVHDATLHAMRSVLALRTKGCTMPSSPLVPERRGYTTATSAVRGVHTDGFTGPIDLDAKGDRAVTNAVVYNAVAGRSRAVANVFGDGVVFLKNGEPTAGNVLPPLVLLGATFEGAVPSAMFPPTQPASESNTLTVSVAVGAAVMVLAVVVIALILFFALRRGSSKDNSNAPKDSTKPFAIVFTDIQASTALWARAPEQMSEAVDVHHATIRRLIARHHGYEVKTIGDSFMVAFHDAKAAVSFSMDVQLGLQTAEWSTSVFDDHYRQLMLDAHLDVSLARDDEQYTAAWNGLRVRVGAHYGLGKIQQDPVTQGFDYYGTVVNTAARVEAVGHGGQTLVTAAVLDGLRSQSCGDASAPYRVPDATLTDLGPQPLRGLDESVQVCQLVPEAVVGRRFPPLRLNVQVDDGDIDGALSDSGSTSSAPQGSRTHTDHATEHSTAHGGHGLHDELVALATRIAQRRVQRAVNGSCGLSTASPPSMHATSPSIADSPSKLNLFLAASGPQLSVTSAPGEVPVIACFESSVTRPHGISEGTGEHSETAQWASSAFASARESPHKISDPLPLMAAPVSPRSSADGTAVDETTRPPVDGPMPGATSDPDHPGDSNPKGAPMNGGRPPRPLSGSCGHPPGLIQIAPASPSHARTTLADKDRDNLVLLASFLRKLLSVVPAKERQRAVTQYAKRWHAKVTTAQEVRGRRRSIDVAGTGNASLADRPAREQDRAAVADVRTLMAVVERVWLTLDGSSGPGSGTPAPATVPSLFLARKLSH